MNQVATKINRLCHEHGVSLSAVCAQAGVNYKTLNAQINRGRDIPIRTVDQLANAFGLPLSFFSEFAPTIAIQSDQGRSILHRRAAQAYTEALRSEQLEMMRAGYEIGTDDVLNWLSSQNNRLTNFDALSEKVDLFFPVEGTDRVMRPFRLGRQSLATSYMQLEGEEHYNRTVEAFFDPKLINRIVASHREVEQIPYKISDETLDLWIDEHHVQVKYRRILARVKDAQGNEFTLLHAKPI